MLHGLEGPDRPAELHPRLRVLRRELERRLRRTDQLGAQHHGRVVDDPAKQRASGRHPGRAGEPAYRPAPAGRAAASGPARARLRSRRLRRGSAASPSPSRATTITQSAVAPSATVGFRPSSVQPSPSARRAWSRCASSGSPLTADLLDRDGAALRARRQVGEQVGRAEPQRRRASRRRQRRSTARAAGRVPISSHDDRHVDQPEPEPAVLLGDQQTGPAEVGDPRATARPASARRRQPSPAAIVDRTMPDERVANRVAEGALVVVEVEVHGRHPSGLTFPDANVRVRWHGDSPRRDNFRSMDFAYTPEDEAFRTELREWLDKNLADLRGRGDPSTSRASTKLYERAQGVAEGMAEGGWAAINWPKDLGGREATLMQNVIYSQEMAKSKAPGIFNANGVWQIGPMIIRWGTQEQKDRWLHGILLRRRALVPGLLRARGRLRPRQPAAAGDPRRRRLRPRRPEDLDHDGAHREVGPVPRPHRPDRDRARREARRHHRADRRHGDARHHRHADHRHRRRGLVLPRDLRQRARSPQTSRASATRARAGWSRWAR